ncbi:MAG: hypothetical protein HXY42_01565 [Chloroflexi bacterium]|nr:hypothetical protein [Chloroflexota bacterium]
MEIPIEAPVNSIYLCSSVGEFQNTLSDISNESQKEACMSHAGKKDKGQKEQKKKPKHTLKEKRKLKHEKEQKGEKKHLTIPG